MSRPALLAISHGTASPEGQAAVAGLVEAVAAAATAHADPLAVRLGHVDVQQPDVEASLATIGGPAVIVPLLLSAGYHVRIDLKKQSAHRTDVAIGAALGPDDRLVDVLAARLAATGRTTEPVVLAVAGSSDERANDDCRAIGSLLAERLGTPVTVGFLAAAEPRVRTAVAAVRAETGTDPVVAAYLLAPGYFHDLTVREADGCRVARPLLDDDAPAASLVELVLDRYDAAAVRESG